MKSHEGWIVSGLVLLIVVLGTGCLGSIHQHSKDNTTPALCSETQISGQTMIINETQNNSVLCIAINSSFIVALHDWSRTERVWRLTGSPGLSIVDTGTTWYDETGHPTTIPGLGTGIHIWNVTRTAAGTQTVQAILRGSSGEITGTEERFLLTITGP